MKRGYLYEPIIANFAWRDKVYRCELYALQGMNGPFFHVFINGINRANLTFDKQWVVSSGRGMSLDIGAQLGEVVEKELSGTGYYKAGKK